MTGLESGNYGGGKKSRLNPHSLPPYNSRPKITRSRSARRAAREIAVVRDRPFGQERPRVRGGESAQHRVERRAGARRRGRAGGAVLSQRAHPPRRRAARGRSAVAADAHRVRRERRRQRRARVRARRDRARRAGRHRPLHRLRQPRGFGRTFHRHAARGVSAGIGRQRLFAGVRRPPRRAADE